VKLSERTVRYHLKLMDERGLTRLVGRRDGRIVTEARGSTKSATRAYRTKSACPSPASTSLSFKTTFDIKKKNGLVPVNISFFAKEQFSRGARHHEARVPEKAGRMFRVAVSLGRKDSWATSGAARKIGLATYAASSSTGSF
jgi:repressor of nif and glnA expression